MLALKTNNFTPQKIPPDLKKNLACNVKEKKELNFCPRKHEKTELKSCS